jgi:predicted nucleic acid-binding protein
MREKRSAKDGPASRKLGELAGVPLYMSIFVACELQAGARLSARPEEELRKVEKFADLIEVVLPDRSFAVAYGECEAFVRKLGRPVALMDLLIGVSAKLYGMPLLTGNASHFKNIPGLIVETY